MPTDGSLLEVLGARVKKELRYFELVELRILLGTFGRIKEARKVFLCVGITDLHIIRASLSGKTHSIAHASIQQVVKVEDSATDLSIEIKDKRVPNYSKLFITSESRTSLLNMLNISYTADAMDRLGKIVNFPLTSTNSASWSKERATQRAVLPFTGYECMEVGDYSFFLLKEFKEVPGAGGKNKPGTYKAMASQLMGRLGQSKATRGGFWSRNPLSRGEDAGHISATVHVYDPIPLADLEKVGRWHIRWLAMEYKQAHIKSPDAVVLRNSLYLKRMNLTNDISAWICWELMIKSREAGRDMMTFIVLLRRQFVPPLMDTAQDFAITFRCPCSVTESITPPDGTVRGEMLMLHECRLAADTLGPQCYNQALYDKVIQAKLDALQFDEEAYGWIQGRLKMKPKGLIEVDKYAMIFLKGILKILSDENALATPEILSEVVHTVADICRHRKSEGDLDPMRVVRRLNAPTEGDVDPTSDSPENLARMHSWQFRLARYFSFCVDGGLIGSKFTLMDIINPIVSDGVTQEGENKVGEILAFLLHLRLPEMETPWSPIDIKSYLIGPLFRNSIFNDRVMQVLVELGYIRRVLAPERSQRMRISRDYAIVLRGLLGSPHASNNLKASVCRQIIAMSKDNGYALDLCPGLLDLQQSGVIFLCVYALGALVNLSQANETVKNFLIQSGIAQIALQHLKSKDDDLILYTLVLMVHLTKSVHHRMAFKQANIVPVLNEILTANYSGDGVKYKRRIVTELCSVIGQLCNDDETRRAVCDQYQVIECLLYVLDEDLKNCSHATTLKSKVLFALKQLCANSQEQKDMVGTRVIKVLVEALRDEGNLEHKDWATNAIMLLLLLAIGRANLTQIEDAGWQATVKVLQDSPLANMDTTRVRIEQIESRLEEKRKGQADQ
mmetsp:Transcript_27069/g.62592  ORF Transcript_27069/g.62592 Transcript_27069/m.62592 type:complete len:902 (+) Transcript_27069:115-2820(+)